MDDSFRTFTQLRGAFTAKRLHKVTACTQQTLPTFFFCEYIVSLLVVIIQGLNLCWEEGCRTWIDVDSAQRHHPDQSSRLTACTVALQKTWNMTNIFHSLCLRGSFRRKKKILGAFNRWRIAMNAQFFFSLFLPKSLTLSVRCQFVLSALVCASKAALERFNTLQCDSDGKWRNLVKTIEQKYKIWLHLHNEKMLRLGCGRGVEEEGGGFLFKLRCYSLVRVPREITTLR